MSFRIVAPSMAVLMALASAFPVMADEQVTPAAVTEACDIALAAVATAGKDISLDPLIGGSRKIDCTAAFAAAGYSYDPPGRVDRRLYSFGSLEMTSKDTAAIFMTYMCGDLCGLGLTVKLTRVSGRWIVDSDQGEQAVIVY